MKISGRIVGALLLFFTLLLTGFHNRFIVLPPGVSVQTPWYPVTDVKLLTDLTYGKHGMQREVRQQIFDAILQMIEDAQRSIVLDMFLFNDFAGSRLAGGRALAQELTNALVEKKMRSPQIDIVFITDPINELYGGLESSYLSRLSSAGISVVTSDLSRLRDSNPLYSFFWRGGIQSWGNQVGLQTVDNPLDGGRVSLRSVLSMLNFKANHRKLVLSDPEDQGQAIVTSANPHDGSSLHSNLALQFSGPAVSSLYAIESKLVAFSSPQPLAPMPIMDGVSQVTPTSDAQLKILTEGKIREYLLELIAQAEAEDRLDIAVFYLSERHTIQALKAAHTRGVQIRVLLDPNKNAFGRKKNGVPNLPVAKELIHSGVAVRWCATQGEQCHSKWILSQAKSGTGVLLLGSANYTRRNLNDFNLETNVAYRASVNDALIVQANDLFQRLWSNPDDERHSMHYASLPEAGVLRTLQYRIMEMTGMSTF